MVSKMNCAGRISALLLLGLLFAGCEGGTGATGATGEDGATGAPGPAGPSSGSGLPVTSAEKINVQITTVTFSADAGPTVEFQLTNDLGQGLIGLPAANIRFAIAQLTAGTAGGSSEWQSYVTRDDGGVTDAQATTETATAGTYVDNEDGEFTGKYQYTFANALDDYPAGPVFDAGKIHRVGIEIRTNTGGFWPVNIPADNAPVDVMPTGGAVNNDDNRLIVNSGTCNACHDNLEWHGEARFDVEYCVQCHNPASIDGNTGNTVDMKRMVHNIHAARPDYVIIGYRDAVHEWSDVVFTQDLRNCETCHNEDDLTTPQASNWREVPNRAACGTCHYDDGDDTNDKHDYAIEDGEHPLGLQFVDDTQCVICHGPDATITNADGVPVRVAVIHTITAEVAGENFIYSIEAVRNVIAGGPPLEIDYMVTDRNGVPYDIDNDPAFTACANGTSRLVLDIGWTTDDFTNTGSGKPNASPVGINALGAGCGGAGTDVDGDGIYTAIAGAGLPAALTGSIAVALEGHPGVDLNGDGVIAGGTDRVPVTSAIAYYGVDGVDTTPRRVVVNIDKCNDCHNKLSMHGGNRTDKPEVCAICHNPNATDVMRRVPDSACVNTLGTDDQTIDLKNMIHGIHSGSVGVCGFGNSAHPYFDVVYPGRLDNCEGCHTEDGYYPVEPGEILGTTVDAVDPAIVTDDVVVSPNTSACAGCHKSSDATAHMEQNGGDFNATKAVDSSLISSGVETCTVCHGPGRTADVKLMHGVGTYEFN